MSIQVRCMLVHWHGLGIINCLFKYRKLEIWI